MCASALGWGSRSSDDGSSHAADLNGLDMPNAAFVCPNLTTLCRLDILGVEAIGGRVLLGIGLCWCVVVSSLTTGDTGVLCRASRGT